MKLRHKIAGTLALPLALAVSSASAAVVVMDNDKGKLEMGGYISGIATWTMYDDKAGHDSKVNNNIGLGTSRLNLKYTNKAGVTLLYENDWASAHTANSGRPNEAGYRLRHAAVMYDGFVVGQTWSGFANLTALGETIDTAGTSGSATWSNRAAVLGKNFDLGEGMSAGLFLEDQNVGSDAKKRDKRTAMPDVTANFKGKFDDVEVFAGTRVLQVDKRTNSNKTGVRADFAVGLNAQLTDDFNLKVGVTAYDKGKVADDVAISLAAGIKANEQLRFNLVGEQYIADNSKSDRTTIWLNGFYKLDSGLEFGGEIQYVDADDNAGAISGLGDSDMALRIQAKYAF